MYQTVLEIESIGDFYPNCWPTLSCTEDAIVPQPLQDGPTADGYSDSPPATLAFWRAFWQDQQPSYRPLQWAGWTR